MKFVCFDLLSRYILFQVSRLIKTNSHISHNMTPSTVDILGGRQGCFGLGFWQIFIGQFERFLLFPLTQVGGYSLLLVLPVSTTVGCACGVQYCYPPLVLVSSTAIHCWSPLLLDCAEEMLSQTKFW